MSLRWLSAGLPIGIIMYKPILPWVFVEVNALSTKVAYPAGSCLIGAAMHAEAAVSAGLLFVHARQR